MKIIYFLLLIISLAYNSIMGAISAINSSIAFPNEGAYFNNPRPQIVGYIKDTDDNPVINVKVTITIDNHNCATVYSKNNGQWDYQLTANQSLADGPHVISIYIDNASEALITNNFAINTSIPPAPIILMPTQHAQLNKNLITIQGNSISFGEIVLYINNDPVSVSTQADELGNWQTTIILKNNSYVLQAQVTDLAGNNSNLSMPIEFTVNKP